MVTAGPTICGTGANSNDGGNDAWANPTYIQTDDTSYSVTSSMSWMEYSQKLKATNFGFSISPGATITNVSFSYVRKASGSGMRENVIAMLDAGGAEGTNKADTSTNWNTSDEAIEKTGNGTYWGVTLNPTLVNDVDFGFVIKTYNSSFSSRTASVDYVSCTVTYTAPVSRVPIRNTRTFKTILVR